VSRKAGCLFLFVLAVLSCTRGETRVEHVYDPYAGPAPYPDLRPKIALPSGDFAIVPSSGSDSLAIVDLALGTAIATAPVGRSPVVLDGPHQVVADLGRRVAYVVESYPDAPESAGNHSHGSSVRPGFVQVLALDDLRAVGEVRVDPNPGEIAVSDDGKRLVVTHYDLAAALREDLPIEARRSTLAVIDPAAIQPFATPEPDKLLVCVAPHGLALSRPDAKKAFVACYGEDALAIVDLEDTHDPVVLVPTGTGTGPYGVALSPDGARVAIGTRNGKDVRFLDVASAAMEALVVPALGETYVPAWSPDGASVYVPTRALDAIALVDAKSGAVVKQRVFDAATCVAPLEVTRGSDPAVVHVLCEGTADAHGAIVTVDAATLETKARVDVGAFPGRPFVGRGP
jgi:DNA-binding beta-propeller fold protein YncE